MANTVYTISVIAVLAVITFLLRALPFLIFHSYEIPEVVSYLGKVLSPAIMTILVCFCLKGLSFKEFSTGFAQLLAVAVTVLTYLWKKNMYISVIISTIFFMVMVQL